MIYTKENYLECNRIPKTREKLVSEQFSDGMWYNVPEHLKHIFPLLNTSIAGLRWPGPFDSKETADNWNLIYELKYR